MCGLTSEQEIKTVLYRENYFLFWFSCKMGDRSLVATIDDFVNPEKGEEARTDALNTLLIRTLPPPLLGLSI